MAQSLRMFAQESNSNVSRGEWRLVASTLSLRRCGIEKETLICGRKIEEEASCDEARLKEGAS